MLTDHDFLSGFLAGLSIGLLLGCAAVAYIAHKVLRAIGGRPERKH